MALPSVNGWMIDYRTAHQIFASQNNRRISHCVKKCEAGTLYISHYEERQFRADTLVAGPFMIDQCCVYEPDDDIYSRCPAIQNAACGKPILVGNGSAVFIAATALSKSLGVISDARSPKLATVFDLCVIYGVPTLSADEYFNLL
jgi:hypothetical protein